MKDYPTVEVYATEVSKRVIVEINFGQRIEALTREKAGELANAILRVLEEDRLLEENYWQCPMCKKVNILVAQKCWFCETQKPKALAGSNKA